MVLVPVRCPYCQSDQVIKGGQTETGKQRYRCQQAHCSHRSFVLEPAYNQRVLNMLNPEEVTVVIRLADEAEVDEMGSFVGRKKEPRWLWHAVDHRSGKVLAYVFGRCQDEVFLKLKALLEPFGITRYDMDYWGAFTPHIAPEAHQPGKHNTQKIERKHLTLRTRIKRLTRKTICFSKSIQMHDIVIGLFINRYEFGSRL